MREIKFRGKRADNGEWVYGCYLFRNGSTTSCGHLISGAHLIHDGDTGFEVDHQTIGQLTGLKDKNGVEIYEGDVLRVRLNDEKTKEDSVYWCSFGKWEWDNYNLNMVVHEAEVIGNIHEEKP